MVPNHSGKPMHETGHYHKTGGGDGCIVVCPVVVFSEFCTRKIVLAIKQIRAKRKGYKKRYEPGDKESCPSEENNYQGCKSEMNQN